MLLEREGQIGEAGLQNAHQPIELEGGAYSV